jgi:antirestriction protein ArdC
MSERVREVLNGIVERFKNGDIPQAIAYSMFPIPDIPAMKWSLLNRTIMFFAGTQDARGYRQWQEAGRHVKKGAKAFSILAPRFAKKSNEEGEDERFLSGFLVVPVFRVEDTDGQPLEYQEIGPLDLPLMEVAERWGISVKAIPGNYRYYGYFSTARKEIGLATKEECVFFHELAHAAHEKVLGALEPGQNWKQEIVAELSAAALCLIVGKTPKYLGNSYRYIGNYAEKAKLSVIQGCTRVMADAEKVLTLILHPEEAAPSVPLEAEQKGGGLNG